jgi:glutamine synthetase
MVLNFVVLFYHLYQRSLVMCDTWTPQGEPLPSNTREIARKSFDGKEDEEVWFGMEQVRKQMN